MTEFTRDSVYVITPPTGYHFNVWKGDTQYLESFSHTIDVKAWITGVGNFFEGRWARYYTENLEPNYSYMTFRYASSSTGTSMIIIDSADGSVIGILERYDRQKASERAVPDKYQKCGKAFDYNQGLLH